MCENIDDYLNDENINSYKQNEIYSQKCRYI